MQINTTRFGVVALEMDDVFHFPQGLIGLESYRHWCLLRDPANDAVAWLQSVSTASLALPTASPRQFAPDYRVQLHKRQLESLQLGPADETYVLVVLASNDGTLTANLRAPIVINFDRRIGKQVVTSAPDPVAFALEGERADASAALRKSA
jgi:flagellar assembly factor FliW